MNKKFKDDGLVNEMEPSSLSDIKFEADDRLSLFDSRKATGNKEYQENLDEENYKNGWYFLYYVTMKLFL